MDNSVHRSDTMYTYIALHNPWNSNYIQECKRSTIWDRSPEVKRILISQKTGHLDTSLNTNYFPNRFFDSFDTVVIWSEIISSTNQNKDRIWRWISTDGKLLELSSSLSGFSVFLWMRWWNTNHGHTWWPVNYLDATAGLKCHLSWEQYYNILFADFDQDYTYM
jgi:hypothetical protein